jgi:hypothetical protein
MGSVTAADVPLTLADRIRGWHRMPYPKNATEHIIAAQLLGVWSPKVEREIREYWAAGCPGIARTDGSRFKQSIDCLISREPSVSQPKARSLAPPATPRTGGRRRLTAGLPLA